MTTTDMVGIASLVVIVLAACVAEYARRQIQGHAKWQRFFDTGSIRRM